MIDIKFLTPPEGLKMYSGMELIDYQGKAFFDDLTEFVKGIYAQDTQLLKWTPAARKNLAMIIARHSHIRVNVNVLDMNNFAIDTGFVSPNSVLNLPFVEQYFLHDESKVGEFFKEFKRKGLTGWCDLKTGTVEGDFKNILFNLYLPERMYVAEKYFKKVNANISIPQVVAAGILHEIGHAFFALHFLAANTLDDVMFAKVAAAINSETNAERKTEIIKGYIKETDIDISEEVAKTGKVSIISFRKGAADRDYRRTLSLGSTVITTEILANAYAVRMGASVSVSALFAASAKTTQDLNLLHLAEIGVYTALIVSGVAPAWALTFFGLRFINGIATLRWQIVNSTHETDYRTIKSILRDVIDILRKARDRGDKKTVNELTQQAMMLDKMADEVKPFLEGSFIQRLLSLVVFGKDAKRMDFEAHTSELNYNPLSVYTQFNNQK